MDLSVVIVNYNVRYYLEQCLHSVRAASEGLNIEIFVVDNHSTDDSQTMLRENFPEVQLIENKENVGFSRANNQAIRVAKGRYVLLLNPDTIVAEDTFRKCISFMDSHFDCGGLGVKMIDGKGNFLPESKRGLPTPEVSFYKIFGLSTLFPKSKKFGKYHLKYLNKDQINEVEVLAGAFMMLRRETLDKVGLLDEDFFMYGEDIDLSYRITQGGYKNYYFPETCIVHYKGESTKKSSVNYVMVFYKAMAIFAKKHFQQNLKWFNISITVAIWFRAALAIVSRIFHAIFVKPFKQIFKKLKFRNEYITIVGNFDECNRIKKLFEPFLCRHDFLGPTYYYNDPEKNECELVQQIRCCDIEELIYLDKDIKFYEIIFCAADIPWSVIIRYMIDLNRKKLNIKIVPPNANFMVGSDDVRIQGTKASCLR